MTTALDGHIEVDETGIARVAGTRLKVIHLVMDKMANGSTPEQMRQQFPPLTLSQIHAALTYYYDHKAELDAQIQHDLRQVETLRSQSHGQPTREQLLERRPGASAGGAES